MLAEVETDCFVQIDTAIVPHPVKHILLLVVLGPGKRGGVKWIVAVAHVSAFGNEALDHGKIPIPSGAMEGGAVVDAGHIPFAILFEEESDGVMLLADVGEKKCEADGVARVHRLSSAS